MRVAVSADMEGIARLEDPSSILAFERSYWESGRRHMTADVVAACRGLLGAGADEVVVLDNHGSGNPENVIGSELPQRARLETWNVFDLADLGVDAMLQVGYHARAGVPAFVSHTYNPELRLRVNGELISESHGRAWAARVPLLGITGNAAHARTLGALEDVPYLVVQHTSSANHAQPVYPDETSAAEAIEEFSRHALRDGGIVPRPPEDPLFEASFAPSDSAAVMAEAGWEHRTDTEFALQLSDWSEAREPLAAAMGAAIASWVPYFATYELTSPEALERVHDEPVLRQGRERFAAWLSEPQQEWLDASRSPGGAAAPKHEV